MKYRAFGRKAGLRVVEVALGTGTFGTRWAFGAEREEAKKVFDGYIEAGGNFIDTANAYQFGESEEILSDFIAAERDALVLSSKYTMGMKPKEGLTKSGNSRKNMVAALEGSLRRLKTDHIDLYWAHISDQETPMEELVRAFDDLVASGKILYAGLSNFPAWRVARADTIAALQGFAPIAGIQIEYSLIERTPERELIPMAEALGIGVAGWSPLGGGTLTGKYRGKVEENTRLAQGGGRLVREEKSDREKNILDTVLAIAKEAGVTAQDVSIAWLLYRAAHSSTGIVPIIGPRNRVQLDANLAASRYGLDAEQFERLNVASAITLGVPGDVIARSTPQILGHTLETLQPLRVPVA
jgi:aryl-alcohol dehydrogenase-like predicted oxidoreductase